MARRIDDPFLWELDAQTSDRSLPIGQAIPAEVVVQAVEERLEEAAIGQVAETNGEVVDDPSVDVRIESSEKDDEWLGGSSGRADDTELQPALFEKQPSWKEHWQGMPEFEMRDLSPRQSIYVHFRNEADRQAFAELVKQTVTGQTRSIWFPKAEISKMMDKRYVDAVPSLQPDDLEEEMGI